MKAIEGVLVGFISSNINLIIVVVGIALVIAIMKNWLDLAMDKRRIEDALNIKNISFAGNKKSKTVEIKEGDEAIAPIAFVTYEEDFSTHLASYNVISQIISIFPLFGILGTVAALILQLNTETDEASDFMRLMINNMGTALGSTFFAILIAIILKTAASIGLLKKIGAIEAMLDNHEKIRSLAKEQAEIFEE